MSILTTATKRLMGKDIRKPVSPVEARDSYRSMIFSAHDLKPIASPRLLRLALDVIKMVHNRQVSIDDIASRPKAPDWFNVWPGEHYRLLAALVSLLQPKTVIEIGTFSGLSALAMKKYLPADGKITTFDIRAWNSVPETNFTADDFADGRLEQKLEDLSDPAIIEKNKSLLESADFMFIDAPKDGVFEYKLLDHFRKLTFRNKPIVFFDDTRLWSMLRFWRELPYPKLDLTSFGAWSGSGLVELT